MNNIGAVILVGGKSRRMGENKALLAIKGKTFLDQISGQANEFQEVLLSVDSADKYKHKNLARVEDLYPGCGPIGGIYSALCACRSDYLLVVSCDMPLFQKELAQYMSAFVADSYDAFVLVTREQRVQPLCAIYSKHAADILKEQIEAGNYRLLDALEKMRVKNIPLRHSVFPDEIVFNVNTPEEYAGFIRRVQGVPIIAVCGVKNSGKTTLLTKVIPILKERGLRVAAIKHDGHDFNPDMPGTDSYRLREAGACGIGVYSPNRYMLTAEQTGITPAFFAPFFERADLILLEGGKHTAYPKIEIVRRGVSERPVSDTSTLLALCSDLDIQVPGVPTLPFDDYGSIAQVIIDHLQG